ncbi:MAG: hypothetical protein LBO74_06600 [Candidatus Symbiothrix sp.]|jgi:hypothetical protein|nr:hypothetical protein [Candidatus Symbiothrix sp.]
MTTNHEISSEEKFQVEQPPVVLPNATVVLVLGILSIPLCCCYGLGLILGIIALVLAGNAVRLYNANPFRYTPSSYKNVSTGKICAIIGIILSAVYIGYLIWAVSYIGWDAISDPQLLQERLQEIINNQ